MRYRFGQFELDVPERRLIRDGIIVKLQDMPIRLLILLVENSGETVTRERARHHLWPKDTFVEFDNSLGVAVGKLREALRDNVSAPIYIETIPRRGYRFIAPVSIITPPEASAIPEAAEKTVDPSLPLKESSASLSPSNPAAHRPRRRGLLLALGVSVAALSAGALFFTLRYLEQRRAPLGVTQNGSAPSTNIAYHNRRRSIAVLGFRNLHGTPDKEWLSEALSQMLSTELAAGGQLRIIPGEDISRVKRELSLKPGESLSQTTLRHLQSEPGADLVVVGAYTSMHDHGKDRLRLDLQLQDTASGSMVAERAFTEDEDRLFDLAAAAGARLRQALQVQASSDDEQGVRTALPANQFAIRLYSAGREKLWGDDWVHARDFLVEAVKADPTFPLTHAALSEAWGHLGYSDKAVSEAKLAVKLSAGLPQEDALAVQARYRQSINDWPKAADDYQMLFTLFPDRVDYGLHLAYAQMNINRQVSLQTIAALRKLPAPLNNDPRIDIAESAAWMNDDLHLARAAAERAVEKAKAQGSNGLMTVGYGMMCQSGGSATFQQAKADCEKARQGYIAAGDRNNAARTLNDLAGFYYGAGDLSGAASMWRLAEQDFQDVGDVQGMSAAANNLGDVAMLEGDLNTAEKYLRKSIPGYEKIGDKDGVARATIDLGELAFDQGMLPVAEKHYRQAIEIAAGISDKDAQASGLAGLGNVLTEQDNLPSAWNTYSQALDLAKNTGDAHLEQDLKIRLARVGIEEGRTHETLLALRPLKEQCSADHNPDGVLATGILLSRALVAEYHNSDLAQKEAKDLQSVVQQSQNRLLREEWSLQFARTQLASGLSDQAKQGIEQVLHEAELHGYTSLGMNAKLARLEWKRNTAGSCPIEEIRDLERSARSHGLALIARRTALCSSSGRVAGR